MGSKCCRYVPIVLLICTACVRSIALAESVPTSPNEVGWQEIGRLALLEAKATSWQRVASTIPWIPRRNAAALVFKDRMWITGGIVVGAYGDVWSSADGSRWEEATPLGFPPRGAHAALVYDGKMWVLGGQDITGSRNDVYSSTDGKTWTQVTASAAWKGRYDFGAVVHSGAMYIFGGNSGSEELNDVWYSTNGADWYTATLAADWSPRMGFAATEFNNLIWVFGGFETGTYHRDVWFSYDGASWARATNSADWSGSLFAPIVKYDNALWMIGNYSEQQDFWTSTDAINWSRMATPPWTGRHGVSVAAFKNRLWMLGGDTSLGNTNEVWSFSNQGKAGGACGCAPAGTDHPGASARGDAVVMLACFASLCLAARQRAKE